MNVGQIKKMEYVKNVNPKPLSMKFYSLKIRDYVEVPEDKIQIVTMKNGKKSAQVTIEKDGQVLKLFKFLGK